MGLLEILTIIFVVLKLSHNIDWSWWLVFAPMYPAAVIYVISLLIFVTAGTAFVTLSRRR